MHKNKLIFGTGFNDNPRKFSKKKFINSINYCADHGIDIFDTADNYFNGKIQTIIGEEISRKKISIINKFQLINDKEILHKNLDRALKKLRRERIDIYMPHWPKFDMNYNLISDFAKESIGSGKIKYFGLSNFNFQMVKDFRKIFQDKLFIQLELNICNYNFNKKIIKYCKNNNIKIFAYKISDNFPKKIESIDKLKQKYNEYEISLIWLKKKKISPIIKSLNLMNIKKNLNVFENYFQDVIRIKNNYISVPISKIKKLNSGSNVIYKNINDAKRNKKKLFPSPIDISKEIKIYGLLKPFFVKKRENSYELLSGQARYWAYQILKKRKFLKAILVD